MEIDSLIILKLKMQRLSTALLFASVSAASNNLALKLETLTAKAPELFLNTISTEDITSQELISTSDIDINTVAPCQYATKAAFFNLAGIVNQDLT